MMNSFAVGDRYGRSCPYRAYKLGVGSGCYNWRDRLLTLIRGRAGGTPGPALVFISLIILGLAVTGAFELLIRFMMTVAITVDLIVLAGIFRLRRKRPELARPLRVPLYPWLPAGTVLLYAIVLIVIVGTQPVLALGAAAMLGTLWATGWLVVRGAASTANQRRER